MSETAGEKTFAPSEKRLRDAASKGDVLRSKDLGTAVVMLVGAAWLAFGGPWLLTDISSLLREAFQFDQSEIADFRGCPSPPSTEVTEGLRRSSAEHGRTSRRLRPRHSLRNRLVRRAR